MSPARKRAQRRANNLSPRRKIDNNNKELSELNDENPKKKKTNKSKTLSNYDRINRESPRTDITDAYHDEKEQAIPSKIKIEKESISSSLAAHNDTLIKDDKIVGGNLAEKSLKTRNEEDIVVESKPSHTKKKIARSPRRAKVIKVCT